MTAGSDAKVILEERARRLAQPASDSTRRPSDEMLTFEHGDERYAIETAVIRGIVSIADLAPIPGIPDYFAGVANARGALLPLVDIGRLLDPSKSGRGDSKASSAIVLGHDHAEFGILADVVHEIDALPVEVPSERSSRVAIGPGVRCILPDAVIVLDGNSLLSDPRLTIDRSVT